MLRCKNCNVDLPDNPKHCPLCGNSVSSGDEAESSCFPNLKPYKNSIRLRLMRLAAFLSVCIVLVCVFINFIVKGSFWSVFVAAGIGSFWADYAVMAKRYKTPIKSIVWQTVLVSAIAVIWDIATGWKGWSVDFVFPIVCSCSSIAIFLGIKLGRLDIRDYILYLIMDDILGIMPLAAVLILKRGIILPSGISFMISAILFIMLLFFRWRELHNEVQRRMHI